MARVRAAPTLTRIAGEAKLVVRLRFPGHDGPLGPGKVQLLEEIDRQGSISGAGRSLGMSYHHAWRLVNALNSMFRDPLVRTQLGGSHGGGAEVTALGHDVVRNYRSMESKLREHAAAQIEALEDALADPLPKRRKRPAS
ncbi:MAG: winged helix-turn-helix domain-containing protein [Candidatus Elarobacter sp.]